MFPASLMSFGVSQFGLSANKYQGTQPASHVVQQQQWSFSRRQEGLIVAVIDLLIGKVLHGQITGLLFARIIIAG